MKNLHIPKPNFDEIKKSLKDYLKQQDVLKDYNFEGSVLNTLLDVLAYNSYFNSFYMNMIATESFIDTATKRHNLIRLANNYGYTPTSAKASKLDLNIIYEWIGDSNNIPNELVLPMGTTFLTKNLNKNYVFTLLDDTVINYDDKSNQYSKDISIYAGKLHTEIINVVDNNTEHYTLNLNDNLIKQDELYSKGFVLKNGNVDTDTLFIYVNDVLYTKHDIADLSVDNHRYFVTENMNGKTCIILDGMNGKVSVGSVIKVVYLSCYGSESNGISHVGILSNLHGYKLLDITVKGSASGGTEKEKNDSIKHNAKRHFESQGRCVTADDYKYFVSQIYPNARSIYVWGGQDNTPPIYGKVFISILKDNGELLPYSEKERILKGIRKRNVITIEPEIIDPNYMTVNIDSLVYYSVNKLSNPINTVMSNIQNSIRQFGNETLNKHNNVFEFSKVTSLIDSADNGVIGNETNISLSQNVLLNSNKGLHKVVYDFDNPLSEFSLISGRFNYNGFVNCYFKEYGNLDNKQRSISICSRDLNDKEITIVTHAGLINYETGRIVFDGGLKFAKSEPISLTLKPVHNVISVKQNTILNIGKVYLKHKSI